MNSKNRGKIEASEHLKSILTERSSPLAEIYKAYQIYQDLSVQLKKDLPEDWQGQVSFLGYRAGVLSLAVPSYAMKTRLNYEKSVLLTHLKKYRTWSGLKDIKIKT